MAEAWKRSRLEAGYANRRLCIGHRAKATVLTGSRLEAG
jgi:hypothetical protein